ncbi:MAG: hypothetical protein DMF60_00785 [Acidobacteria bacterium]|nr:MAG: hypothetical protein DMF60_00785 [Acidobacteriota bacterium]
MSQVRIAGIVLLLVMTACGRKLEGTVTLDNKNAAPGPASSSQISAAQIIEKYRSLDNSHDSTIKMRAVINSQEDSAGLNTPRQIQLTTYRKREPDDRLLILAEFTSPPEERDRDGLITVFPDGRIEAVRYVQSTDSFLVATDATSEDALFGLTPQELADGQPEKYDFTMVGEETYQGTPVYRLEGKLKQGAESKFPRVILLISKQDFAAMEAEFYDNHNELARRLVVSKAEHVAGHWTRLRWTIDNLARRKKIDFETVEVKYDQNLSYSIFTREHLKKIASR